MLEEIEVQAKDLIPTSSSVRRDSVEEAIIACMLTGRHPTPTEVSLVAARIWKEYCGRQTKSWSAVPQGSIEYRKMMSAARTALGHPPRPPIQYEPVSPHDIWWREAHG